MTDLDLNDLMLEATAEVQEIIREIMEELAEPHMKEQAAAMWARMPDEMKELYAQERPEEYRAIMELLDERRY